MTAATRAVAAAATTLIILLASSGCSKDEGTNDPTPPVSTINDTIRPVVFVHGYLQAADAFAPMAQLFRLNEYAAEQLHAFDFENVMTIDGVDAAEMTRQLKSAVATLRSQTGADRVDIVAHGVGAQAVQRFLVSENGTAVTAHVAFLGGIFDPAQTSGGVLTPSPCKYLSLRSNGNDATQHGDPSAGTLAGAENRVINDADHQQLLAGSESFSAVHAFFTGRQPSVTVLPNPVNLKEYAFTLRVISMFDNSPVQGAIVTFRRLKKNLAERQTGGPSPVTSDAQGYVTISDVVNPNFDLEISVSASGYHDMHIYRQSWRSDSRFERLRILPKTGGSAVLQAFRDALPLSGAHALTIVHTPYQASYNGRDRITVEVIDQQNPPVYYDFKSKEVINENTGPLPSSTGAGANTFMIVLADFRADKVDSDGPETVASLNSWGVSSWDLFMNSSDVSLNYGSVTANARKLAFRNFRSQGTTPNNGGLNIVQLDYTR